MIALIEVAYKLFLFTLKFLDLDLLKWVILQIICFFRVLESLLTLSLENLWVNLRFRQLLRLYWAGIVLVVLLQVYTRNYWMFHAIWLLLKHLKLVSLYNLRWRSQPLNALCLNRLFAKTLKSINVTQVFILRVKLLRLYDFCLLIDLLPGYFLFWWLKPVRLFFLGHLYFFYLWEKRNGRNFLSSNYIIRGWTTTKFDSLMFQYVHRRALHNVRCWCLETLISFANCLGLRVKTAVHLKIIKFSIVILSWVDNIIWVFFVYFLSAALWQLQLTSIKETRSTSFFLFFYFK